MINQTKKRSQNYNFRLNKQIRKCITKVVRYPAKNSLYKLFSRRLQCRLLKKFSEQHLTKKVKDGLELFEERTEELFGKLQQLYKHNLSVFAPIYDNILLQKLQKQ